MKAKPEKWAAGTNAALGLALSQQHAICRGARGQAAAGGARRQTAGSATSRQRVHRRDSPSRRLRANAKGGHGACTVPAPPPEGQDPESAAALTRDGQPSI